jgi:hypothetical protein
MILSWPAIVPAIRSGRLSLVMAAASAAMTAFVWRFNDFWVGGLISEDWLADAT